MKYESFKKIDVFYFGKYLYSTNSHKNCRDAISSFKDILRGDYLGFPQTRLTWLKRLNAINPELDLFKITANFSRSK